jgi:hypothetical protein
MPSNPLTLSVTGTTSKPVIHVTWGAIASATSYTLQMNEPAAGAGWTTVATSSGWSRLFLYSGEVDFHLQACNSAGCSGWSATQSVTVHGGSGMSTTQPAASSSSPGGVP